LAHTGVVTPGDPANLTVVRVTHDPSVAIHPIPIPDLTSRVPAPRSSDSRDIAPHSNSAALAPSWLTGGETTERAKGARCGGPSSLPVIPRRSLGARARARGKRDEFDRCAAPGAGLP